MIKKTLLLLTKSTAAYVIGQLLTGIEAGFFGAYLYLIYGTSFLEAVTVAVSALFPAMIIQTLIAFYVITKIQRSFGAKKKEETS